MGEILGGAHGGTRGVVEGREVGDRVFRRAHERLRYCERWSRGGLKLMQEGLIIIIIIHIMIDTSMIHIMRNSIQKRGIGLNDGMIIGWGVGVV